MSLSPYLSDAELAESCPSIPFDFQYSPEPDAEDDPADHALLPGRYLSAVKSIAEAEADALIAAQEEPASKVVRLLETAHATPHTVFDRCFSFDNGPQVRSRHSIKVCEYRADCYLAASAALRSDQRLFYLFHLLWEQGYAATIPLNVLARSADVQQIKQIVGTELRRRGLFEIGKYFSRRKGRQ